MKQKEEAMVLDLPESDAGYLIITDQLWVASKKKPNKFHLKMMKMFFGWEWEDNKKAP